MTMLAVALPWTTALSINLRCATLLLPIAIDRPSPPLHRPLPNQAVNAPQQQTASAEIPIASDAPLRHISRGFLPWRFADAGPAARGTVIMGRHPKTFTMGDIAGLAWYERGRNWAAYSSLRQAPKRKTLRALRFDPACA
jgi:hypothetical protein